MKKNLTLEVAKIVDGLSFSLTPSLYGLQTEKELEERTLVGPGRRIALEKARKIIKLVRSNGQQAGE
jgi:hypothetical protein